MYIGSTNLSGIKNLITYFLDDVKAETETQICIELDSSNRVHITASSATISELKTNLLLFCVDSRDIYPKWSLFLLIALSEDILIRISDSQSTIELRAQKGNHQLVETAQATEPHTLFVDFKLDFSIFNEIKLSYEILNNLFRQYAFLNPGIEITSIDNRTAIPQRCVFHYPQGVTHELDYRLGINKTYESPHLRMDLKAVLNNFSYQLSFALLAHDYDQSYITTYANSEELVFGGSFLNGILEGIHQSIKELAKHYQQKINLSKRTLKSRLILIASVQVVDPQKSHFNYGSSIKGWLEMPTLERDVKNYVFDQLYSYLQSNESTAQAILEDFRKWEHEW